MLSRKSKNVSKCGISRRYVDTALPRSRRRSHCSVEPTSYITMRHATRRCRPMTFAHDETPSSAGLQPHNYNRTTAVSLPDTFWAGNTTQKRTLPYMVVPDPAISCLMTSVSCMCVDAKRIPRDTSTSKNFTWARPP